MNTTHPHTNRLAESTSPYLLQHAHNPVDWYPWGEEALAKAKQEDKPILVSIGYSSCHWCHVMERESFENDSIASIMNKSFINIKVDREERPDVDQIYMDAVQAMGLNGGWPLNVFLTPDQKPFYGGTYFPPENWIKLLKGVADAYSKNREKLEESADNFASAIGTSEIKKYGLTQENNEFNIHGLDNIYQKLASRFDKQKGGMDKAPKFPMPSNWLFLLQYYHHTKNNEALQQAELTLDEIAFGGIYDQVGGGFARYSTDADWFAPHFEKMMYDNGQLVSLYSEAYQVTGKPLYKEVVYETIAWLQREMTNSEGGFYSALDADSEGEEGKFYVWTQGEFNRILEKDKEILSKYYNIKPNGNWEHGNNILHKRMTDEKFASKNNISITALRKTVKEGKNKLLKARSNRVRPGLDNKILTSWNAIMLKGLVDAYHAFGDEDFLKLAIQNAVFIDKHMEKNGKLLRTHKDGVSTIDGYLEDYAFVSLAYTSLYQATFDEVWLQKAKKLVDYTLQHFFDEKEEMFFYTDDSSERLIARKKELFDNVIPASNSAMAISLYQMGIIFDNDKYRGVAAKMIGRMNTMIVEEPAYLSNWAVLYGYHVKPTAEIVIVGDQHKNFSKEINAAYYPNKVVMAAKNESTLPLMEQKRSPQGKTTIFVCYNKTCKLPVYSVKEAMEQLK